MKIEAAQGRSGDTLAGRTRASSRHLDADDVYVMLTVFLVTYSLPGFYYFFQKAVEPTITCACSSCLVAGGIIAGSLFVDLECFVHTMYLHVVHFSCFVMS